jgi:hypothetical protein
LNRRDDHGRDRASAGNPIKMFWVLLRGAGLSRVTHVVVRVFRGFENVGSRVVDAKTSRKAMKNAGNISSPEKLAKLVSRSATAIRKSWLPNPTWPFGPGPWPDSDVPRMREWAAAMLKKNGPGTRPTPRLADLGRIWSQLPAMVARRLVDESTRLARPLSEPEIKALVASLLPISLNSTTNEPQK